MTGQLIFIVLTAAAVMAFAIERTVARVREANARYKAAMNRRQQQVERIRKVAGESIALRREVRALHLQLEDLKVQTARLQKDMDAALRPENRLFILDERRTPMDETWIVAVAAPAPEDGKPRPPWEGSRRFLVWAPDEATAQTKVGRRYQAAAGFLIDSIVARPKAAAKR